MKNAIFRIFLSLGILIPSCEGAVIIHTYNAGRDKAAQAIKDAYAKVDVIHVINLQATNLAALAGQELSVLEAQAIGRRDAELFRIISGTNSIAQSVFTNIVAAQWRELLGM